MEFYRKQIEQMPDYMRYRDLLRVLLAEDVKYTLAQADEMINDYLEIKEAEE